MELKAFYEPVRAQYINVPKPMVERVARDVVRQFAEDTFTYIVKDKFTSLPANQATFFVSPPQSHMVIRIASVTVDGTPLEPASPAQMDSRVRQWRTQVGKPSYFWHDQEDEVRVVPMADQHFYSNVEVVMAVKPKRDAVDIDDLFVDQYYETLLAGILGHFYSQSDKPWSDPNKANMQLGFYLRGVEQAKIRRAQDHTSRHRTVKYGGL